MPVISDIYYYQYEGSSIGQRPTLVLIHGAGGTHLYWPPEVRRLPGSRVYAPDLPGHGKSGGRGRQSIQEYTEAVLDWLTSIGIHRAVFVGHSMGSAIALNLALDHPEHVVGVVLIGGGARFKVAESLLDYAESATTYMNAIKLIVEWSFSSNASNRLRGLAGQRMAETRASVLHGDLSACQDFDETGRLSELNKPALVICGIDDRMMPPRYSQYLAEQIPGAELQLISDAGHMVQLEKPQLVANAILNFLTGIKYF
jgi:pimeloyl-ACP methyl ester carboxylesterase